MITAAIGYFILLCSLILLITGRGRNAAMFRTILAIAFNSILANTYTLATGETSPWHVFMVLDVLAATIILVQPAGRIQAIIGWTYVAQLAMHTGYALNGASADPVIYWWSLTVSGYVQLLLVGGWWARGQWPDFLRIRRQRKLAPASHQKSVDR